MTSGFQREFVADPATGSKHNRGCAVDSTMYDLALARLLRCRAVRRDDEAVVLEYKGGPPEARARRDLLRAAMERHGFTVEPNEWWHFNYKDWREYPILDIYKGHRVTESPRMSFLGMPDCSAAPRPRTVTECSVTRPEVLSLCLCVSVACP